MKAKKSLAIAAGCGMILPLIWGCTPDQWERFSEMNQPSGLRATHQPEPRTAEFIDQQKVEDRPILPRTHVAAGRLHESRGQYGKAAEQYRQAIEVDPTYCEAYNRLGVVLDRLGQYEEADEAFHRALLLSPNSAHLHNNLGFSYILQSRWTDACAELYRALEFHPDFLRARVNLGLALGRQGRFDEALEQFKVALPEDEAFYNLGMIYQVSRLPVDAARAFKESLRLNPGLVAAERRLKALPADVVSKAEGLPEAIALAMEEEARISESLAQIKVSTDSVTFSGEASASPQARRESPAAEEMAFDWVDAVTPATPRADDPVSDSADVEDLPLCMEVDEALPSGDPLPRPWYLRPGPMWDSESWVFEDDPDGRGAISRRLSQFSRVWDTWSIAFATETLSAVSDFQATLHRMVAGAGKSAAMTSPRPPEVSAPATQPAPRVAPNRSASIDSY
jgi:tetratricopeptide (TPR) repeat protein